MTDIVNQLDEACHAAQHSSREYGCATCCASVDLLSDASDEIERLRAALAELVALERITTPDMSCEPRKFATMQNGRALAEALDKAQEALGTANTAANTSDAETYKTDAKP